MSCCGPRTIDYRHPSQASFETELEAIGTAEDMQTYLVLEDGHLVTRSRAFFPSFRLRRHLHRYIEANTEYLQGSLSDNALRGLYRIRECPAVRHIESVREPLTEAIERLREQRFEVLCERGRKTHLALMQQDHERLNGLIEELCAPVTNGLLPKLPQFTVQAKDGPVGLYPTTIVKLEPVDLSEYSIGVLGMYDLYVVGVLQSFNMPEQKIEEMLRLAKATGDEWLQCCLSLNRPVEQILYRPYATYGCGKEDEKQMAEAWRTAGRYATSAARDFWLRPWGLNLNQDIWPSLLESYSVNLPSEETDALQERVERAFQTILRIGTWSHVEMPDRSPRL